MTAGRSSARSSPWTPRRCRRGPISTASPPTSTGSSTTPTCAPRSKPPSRRPTRRSPRPSRSASSRSCRVEWTEEGGQLTPSLKLRRDVVMREHVDEVEALYSRCRAGARPKWPDIVGPSPSSPFGLSIATRRVMYRRPGTNRHVADRADFPCTAPEGVSADIIAGSRRDSFGHQPGGGRRGAAANEGALTHGSQESSAASSPPSSPPSGTLLVFFTCAAPTRAPTSVPRRQGAQGGQADRRRRDGGGGPGGRQDRGARRWASSDVLPGALDVADRSAARSPTTNIYPGEQIVSQQVRRHRSSGAPP